LICYGCALSGVNAEIYKGFARQFASVVEEVAAQEQGFRDWIGQAKEAQDRLAESLGEEQLARARANQSIQPGLELSPTTTKKMKVLLGF
jgi:hypothetical protein